MALKAAWATSQGILCSQLTQLLPFLFPPPALTPADAEQYKKDPFAIFHQPAGNLGAHQGCWDAEIARVTSLQSSPMEHAANQDGVLRHSSKSTPQTHTSNRLSETFAHSSEVSDSSERLSTPK